jgi:peptidoglycan/xylan/chitin deacetylase (PgdA/CDA1 family)
MRVVKLSLILILIAGLIVPAAGTHAQQPGPFRVYLTFEDGPTEWYTPTILDILAQYGAHATFFVNGYQIAGHESILQRILREGHALGNHLWEEPGHYAGTDEDATRESYLRTEDALRAALGDTLPIYDAQTRLYRTPGGGALPLPAIEGAQAISYNWQVSGNDCGSALKWDSDISIDAQILRNIFDNRPQFNIWDFGDGAVIVLHDINSVTERILPTLLSRLQAAGGTFEALPRPGDAVNTMPIILGAAPLTGSGIPGTRLPGITLDYVNFRTAPDQAAALVIPDPLPLGTSLTVTGRASGWVQAEVQGQTGWIAADYVEIEGPIPNLPLLP